MSSKLLLRHWNLNPPKPKKKKKKKKTLIYPLAKRTGKHHASVDAPPCCFERNTAKACWVRLWVPSQHLSRNHDIDQVLGLVDFIVGLWVCLGLLISLFLFGCCVWLLEKKSSVVVVFDFCFFFWLLLSEYWNRVCKARFQFKRNWFLRTRFNDRKRV